MPSDAGAGAGALDATVEVERARSANRLRADVAQCRRVLDELVEGATAQAAKAAEVVAIYKAKERETDRMIVAAKRALKDAEQALKTGEG